MRVLALASRTFRTILWVILGILLLVAGILLTLYSSWGQDALREHFLAKLNSIPGTEVRLDSLRLKFPLTLDISGLAIVQNGDTMVAASRAEADVALMPLFKGDVSVKKLALQQAAYQMGNADSAMELRIKAKSLLIEPAAIKLSPLDIDIIDGNIEGGLVSLTSRTDTAAAPKPAAEASPLTIKIGKLKLRDFTYQMQMLPTIDSLGANIGEGALVGGEIDLLKQTVKLGTFSGSHLSAAYIAPDAAEIAANPIPAVADTLPAPAPWTITIDSIHFAESKGLYTTRGYKPLPGLDFGYIQADSMELTVTDFYNQATNLTLPIKLRGTERCGITLDASGTLSIDSAAMYFKDFEVSTPFTRLSADGMLGVGDMTTDPSLPMRLMASGYLGIPDARLMFPAAMPYLAAMPDNAPITIEANVGGTVGALDVNRLDVKLNRIATLRANGRILGMFGQSGPSGNINLQGNILDVNHIVKSLAAGAPITVPPMTLNGHVAMNHGAYKGDLKATTLGGTLALDGSFNGNTEGYNIDLSTTEFPVGAFMKDLGVGVASIDLKAKGQGFDLFSPKTSLDASLAVKKLEYNGYNYHNLSLDALIADGNAKVNVKSDNSDLDANIMAHGNLVGDTYDWTATIDGQSIDLYALKFAADPAKASALINIDAQIDPKAKSLVANAVLKDAEYADQTAQYALSDVHLAFATSDTLTTAQLTNRDFIASLNSPCSLDSISARFGRLSTLLQAQIDKRELQPDSLQQEIPPFDLYVSAGANNFVNDILLQNKMLVQRIDIKAANDSVVSLHGRVLGFQSQSMRLDTIAMDIKQRNNRIQLTAEMDNRPGSFDEFAHVDLSCILNTNKMALRATQRNIQNATGFDIGAMTVFADSTITARIFPLTPTIGYKKWTVNLDNFISYNFPERKIDANLRMKGDKSALALYSEPADSLHANNIALQLTDIRLADWIAINPWAPPITGDLSADLHLNWDGSENINGNGDVTLADFTYDKQRVGTFVSNLDVATSTTGRIRAKANLLIDGQETMTIAGALNDSTAVSPFNLDFNVIHFPLKVANPFLPAGVATLSGTLNGKMDISGDAAKPLLNGELQFDQAAVKLGMTGTKYAISDVKIPVEDNVVTFSDFGILGANENPLAINGTVDLHSLISPRIDLKLDANNMMLVNTNSLPKGADIFGKAYINLGASVKGNMRYMAVDADLTVLAGTNVTYQLSDAMSTMQSPTQTNMVKFVNFNDTLQVLQADTIADNTLLMAINANLVIQSGTTITVNLSSTNRDKVQLMPTANLNYTQTPMSPDGRLTGRITIDEGFARYTIPIIGQEKMFNFDPGSYVAFNGDILNPVLNVHAYDQVKTNVTQEGQNSRLVNFDILLGVTGTLEQMNVAFDLSTADDLSIANELQSMSAEQRANQAMNLLLYNVYTGPGTKATANLSANPLYSFLESQVNNWAANNIKGVDLSFGIDQYNQTTNGSTSTAMSYSYQVSKSLFNDRFKIVVGGNYNTNENSDENLSENLINDISFVYYLNKQRTMLIKLFRHTGFESILEGEITQTGVGFVYKRKLNNLVQILPKFMRPHKYRKIQQ